jgi:hypothetical protein
MVNTRSIPEAIPVQQQRPSSLLFFFFFFFFLRFSEYVAYFRFNNIFIKFLNVACFRRDERSRFLNSRNSNLTRKLELYDTCFYDVEHYQGRAV